MLDMAQGPRFVVLVAVQTCHTQVLTQQVPDNPPHNWERDRLQLSSAKLWGRVLSANVLVLTSQGVGNLEADDQVTMETAPEGGGWETSVAFALMRVARTTAPTVILIGEGSGQGASFGASGADSSRVSNFTSLILRKAPAVREVSTTSLPSSLPILPSTHHPRPSLFLVHRRSL